MASAVITALDLSFKEIFSSNYSEDEFNSFYEQTIEPLAIQMSEAFSLGLLTDNEIMRWRKSSFYSERLQYASWNTKVNCNWKS